jgi:hypothetical protein
LYFAATSMHTTRRAAVHMKRQAKMQSAHIYASTLLRSKCMLSAYLQIADTAPLCRSCSRSRQCRAGTNAFCKHNVTTVGRICTVPQEQWYTTTYAVHARVSNSILLLSRMTVMCWLAQRVQGFCKGFCACCGVKCDTYMTRIH